MVGFGVQLQAADLCKPVSFRLDTKITDWLFSPFFLKGTQLAIGTPFYTVRLSFKKEVWKKVFSNEKGGNLDPHKCISPGVGWVSSGHEYSFLSEWQN